MSNPFSKLAPPSRAAVLRPKPRGHRCRRIFIVLLAPLLFSGCITRCRTELFYKPEVVDSALSVSAYNAKVVFKNIGAGVDIEVMECGTAYRRSDKGPTSICVLLSNPGKSPVAFLTQALEFTVADGVVLKGHAFGPSAPYPSKPNGIFFSGDFPITSAEMITVQLPTLTINGTAVQLPSIKFRRVTESICGTFARLLSKQA